MLFKILALAQLVLFYSCYLIKMAQQRKQGIQTDQMGRNTSGFAKGIELSVKVMSVAALAAEVWSVTRGISGLPLAARVAGACIGAAGVAVFYAAVLTLRDNWRAGVPQKGETGLVTGGVFSVSRNPAFLGFDLLYLGILLMFFSWGLFFISVVTMLLFHLQIVNVEEEFLADAFGEEYFAYKSRVCRYLGRRNGHSGRG